MSSIFTLEDLVSFLINPSFYQADSADIAYDCYTRLQNSGIRQRPFVTPDAVSCIIGTSNESFDFVFSLKPVRWSRVIVSGRNITEEYRQTLYEAFMDSFQSIDNELAVAPGIICHHFDDGPRLEYTYIYCGGEGGREA